MAPDVIMMRHRFIHACESTGSIGVDVIRLGACTAPAAVRYRTRLDGARESVGTLQFEAGQVEQRIQITIDDDAVFEIAKHFLVQLVDATGAELDAMRSSHVYVIDDDAYPAGGEGQLSDRRLLAAFLRERWRHRHPKPLVALVCRCYAAIDKVVETAALSLVLLPLLQRRVARAAAASDATANATSEADAGAGAASGVGSTWTVVAVGGMLVGSFLVKWWTSRKYQDLRGNSGTRKDLRNWIVAKMAWWGEDNHTRRDSMQARAPPPLPRALTSPNLRAPPSDASPPRAPRAAPRVGLQCNHRVRGRGGQKDLVHAL
jgi:hypothetical protein